MPPNIEISAPRGTNIHPTVFRLNGGKGGTCLQVPSGTRDVAKKFDALINSMKYVKYGQSRIFFFTHDYATSGGEQPTASSAAQHHSPTILRSALSPPDFVQALCIHTLSPTMMMYPTNTPI
jgi:hypothetical protein